MMSEVDKAQLVALLAQYDQKNSAVAECKLAAVKAEFDRSKVVQAILDANGGKKKLRRNGQELTIVVRGDTFFFRSSKDSSDITEV